MQDNLLTEQPDTPTKKAPVVVHLPFYDDNPYQTMLMQAQSKSGWRTMQGGGGGNFLRTALRKWDADVYHFHWLHPYLLRDSTTGTLIRSLRFLGEVLLLKWAGAKIVHTVHNSQNHARLHTSLEYRFTRRFLALADSIIVHGRAAEKMVLEKYGQALQSKLRILPHPNYRTRYQNWRPTTTSKARGDRGTRFGYLGRISAYKQIGHMIRAFQRAAGTIDTLTIMGRCDDPQLLHQLQDQSQFDSRISICEGYVSDTDVPDFFDNIDVCLCPSEGILTSGSVWLSLTFHTPVIAPKEGCIPEHVGNAGWLYDERSTLEHCITTARKSHESLSTYAAAAARSSEVGDLQTTCNAHLRLYKDSLALKE